MSTEQGAPAADAAPASEDTSELSLEDARKLIDTQLAEPDSSAESADPATAEQDLPDEGNADPETDPGDEAPKDDEPAKEPPIERPRSWTKDEDAEWQSLPRAMQQKIVAREQERDTGLRRSQNEAAEARKAVEAERAQVEKARQEYEAKLPAIAQALQDAHAGQYADIKTMADVEKLAAEDPFRYLQWQAHQQKVQAVQNELNAAQGREAQAHQSKWQDHIAKENALAAEYIPELADKTKGPALTQRAADRLTDLGFKQEELAALASGKEKLSLYDHRIQRLIFSDLKLAEIQAAPKAVAAKPVPAVQRPGVSRPAGSQDNAQIQALEERLTRTGSIKDAEALLNAQLKAATRRRAS